MTDTSKMEMVGLLLGFIDHPEDEDAEMCRRMADAIFARYVVFPTQFSLVVRVFGDEVVVQANVQTTLADLARAAFTRAGVIPYDSSWVIRTPDGLFLPRDAMCVPDFPLLCVERP